MSGHVDPIAASYASGSDVHDPVAGDSDRDVMLDPLTVRFGSKHGGPLQYDIDYSVIRARSGSAGLMLSRHCAMSDQTRTHATEPEAAQRFPTVHHHPASRPR
jgi:hypothetical protein